MKIDPRAGQLANATDLVDVPKLIAAYYEERPDPGIPAQRVVFATSGHRGSSFEKTFNEWHILAITQAICLYRKQHKIEGPLFLGIDTHALSKPAVDSALEVLAADGIDVMLAGREEYTPTPVISHAILTYNLGRTAGLADGIVITPSHNPPDTGGFKYNPPHGGPAEENITAWIENQANRFLVDGLRGVNRVSIDKALTAATTHRHDFLTAYVDDLHNIIDMEAIRASGLSVGVNPLGGAGVHYWEPIAKRYGFNLTVVNETVDPTFRFMTLDWDGKIRMDPSSQYAMRPLIALKDKFDLAIACDTDHDRHGIVTRSVGLLPPNHYLAVCVDYLFMHRPSWGKDMAVGKTVVSSSMIDRVAARRGRKLYEVPVGFKYFVDGLLKGSLGFAGEESAGSSFARMEGSVWTTDKDGIIAALLAAEITAICKKDPGELYTELAAELGDSLYRCSEAAATREQKEALEHITANDIHAADLAGEKPITITTKAAGDGNPIGGIKVAAANGWFAARPSGTEAIYKIYAESFSGKEHLALIEAEAQTVANHAFTPATSSYEPRASGDKVSDQKSSKPGTNTLATKAEPALGIDALNELAMNLHWSWNHMADPLWEALDSYLWHTTQNPWVILQTVSEDKVKTLLETPDFQERLSALLQHKRKFFSVDAWFQKTHPDAALSMIAYFSMEFMLTEALPIYSGGLGNVAGDQMKAASDLGVPVVGVGLLWGQGYFRQDFDADGSQRVLYPVNDPGQLPIQPLRRANGEWLRIQIQLPGAMIWLRCWQVLVGRIKLFLLDANDFANTAAHRGITSELYGGDAEMRLKQEIVLGIGGWRMLRELGLDPEVCHLNEGHAAFAVLERARYYMADHHVSFEVAMTITRAGNLFTTHTAVPAGFDRFAPELCWKYLGHYAKDELAICMEQLLALGRQNSGDTSEPLNMAYLALRGSGQVSGVSKLHGEVSRHIFQPLFPRWPQAEVPVGSVTNGIHVPTWDSAGADTLWTKVCGADRWRSDRPLAEDVRRLTDTELWRMRTGARKTMLTQVRDRYTRQLSAEGGSHLEVAEVFKEDVLTVGFARRFATYKRPDLLLHDPDRLIRLLTNSQHPVQLILAGKAHPEDLPGQALIKEWNDFIKRPEVRSRVVFLSDYDMQMAQELVKGMDLWINTPRRPWEACGTSGMKVLANGGLNISELDGWWAEAYTPEVGWAIGDGREHGEDAAWDTSEVESLYSLLEQQVVPEFYNRGAQGLPSRWLGRVRESMATLTPEFSASRAIREYTNDHYLPAAAGYNARSANDGEAGTDLSQWQRNVTEQWSTLRFDNISSETKDGQHRFQISVVPGALRSDQFRVELYAGPSGDSRAMPEILTACKSSAETSRTIFYSVCCPAKRPASDYTARVIPWHAGASVPLEAGQILWQE